MKKRKEVLAKPRTKVGFVKVPIELEVDNEAIHAALDEITKEPEDDFARLSKKFGHHFNLSVARNGKSVLVVHGKPSIVFTALSAPQVIEEALAY